MRHSVWRGVINVGMVSIPVRLYVATESHSVTFRQLCGDHMSPIRNRRWCAAGAHEVPYADVVRGYEVSSGNFVVFEEWEMDELPHPSKRVILISTFVPQHAITGGLFFKSAYYVEPEPAVVRPFRLLTQALAETGMTAMARIAFRDREHLCCMQTIDNLLLLNTIHWPDEIRPPERPRVKEDEPVDERELQMAKTLVRYLAVDTFDPRRYRDEHRDALVRLVNLKVEGGRVVGRPGPEVAPVMNLMEALMASVKAARKQRGARPGARARRAADR